ncbi:MAG TPA: hypothetical protein VFX76_10550, partial [Roseiflexaceae bacterium]|nr:hypothetical protein [Roseiflexaceae bacterium]
LIIAVAGIIGFSINPPERNDQTSPTIAEATALVLASMGTTTLPTPKAASLESTMLATPSPPGASSTPTSAHIGCFADYFAGVPATGQVTMVVDPNVRDKRKVETGGSANDRIGILLTVNSQPIGAVRVRRLPNTAGFIIEEIVDANCVANGHWENDDANTPHQQPANWGNTIITIGEVQYWLYMGSPGSKAPVEIITKAM